jgi:competence protein ComEA
MIRSLSLKLAMLVVTMGVVFWIRWQPVELQQRDSESIDPPSVTMTSSMAEPPTQTTPVRQSASGPVAVIPGEASPVGVADRTVPRLVDLNSATVDELESLPGIGAVLAQRVIDHRKTVGRFITVQDLREVKGIGSKKFEQIKSLVTVARGELKGKTEKRTS